jgi:hypothetical protein
MGFVTYTTADARPTPILAKRFFSAWLPVFKELSEPAKLGIGHNAISSGITAMSALEGLVAAVEVLSWFNPCLLGSQRTTAV